MEITNNPNALIRTDRTIDFSPEQVFSAFSQAEKLAKWWGPDGFTNTFEVFEFKQNGNWIFTMHSADGVNYLNESIFKEIQPNSKIVIEHIVQPIFTLTINLTAQRDSTKITWVQEFESETFATKMRDFLESANQQNLDRLVGVLKNHIDK